MLKIVPTMTLRETAGGLEVTRRSPISGQEGSMILPVTADELRAWQVGSAYIQDVFPQLDADQREFLKTGITAEEWNKMFPPEEGED